MRYCGQSSLHLRPELTYNKDVYTNVKKNKQLFTIIDIETTGNSYRFGGITEIAIISFNGNEITHVFDSLVNPGIDIPLPITRLTGITNQMVKDAPKFYEIARTVAELTASKIFVAHNVSFDYKFFQQEFGRLGFDFQRKKLCTVQMARKLIPGHASYSLGRLCGNLGIPIESRHRAIGDAMATTELFKILLKVDSRSGKESDGQGVLSLF